MRIPIPKILSFKVADLDYGYIAFSTFIGIVALAFVGFFAFIIGLIVYVVFPWSMLAIPILIISFFFGRKVVDWMES